MKSFRISVIGLIILSLVIGLGGLSTLAYFETRSQLTSNLEQALVSLASASSAQVGDWLGARKSEMELIARKNLVQSGDKAAIMAYLDHETRDNSLYEQFFVADAKGDYYMNSGQTGSIADRDYFREVMATGQTVISDPLVSRGSGSEIIVVAAPIRTGGEITGIVGGNVAISDFSRQVSSVKVGNTGYAIMLQDDGLIVAHPDSNLIMRSYPLTDRQFSSSWTNSLNKMLNRETGFANYSDQGEDRIIAYAPVPNISWSLGVVVPATYISSQLIYLPEFFVVITVVFAFVLSFLLNRWLVKPLTRLNNATTSLAMEPLSQYQPAQINSPVKEIVSLTQNFREMENALKSNLRTLEESIRDLRLSEQRFAKAFYGSANMKSIVRLADYRYIDVNEEAIRSRGFSRAEIIGKTPCDIGVPPEEVEKVFNLLKENGSIRNLEVTIVSKGGEFGVALLSAELIEIDGELCGMLDYNVITDLKKIQQAMARLDRLNLVGQMAAGIGHEIRNPMTTVRGYLQLLGSKPDLFAYQSQFNLMIEELDRTNSIISEFLSLARNKPSEIKRQDLNHLLENLAPLLQADAINQNKEFILERGAIPEIEFNAKEISQLVLNLARNGLEAMSPGGKLAIKTCLDCNHVALTVADQGSGIDEEIIPKLGTPFFTTKDNGTGLGLAICYSIAERNRAQLTFESGPAGTTFCLRFDDIMHSLN